MWRKRKRPPRLENEIKVSDEDKKGAGVGCEGQIVLEKKRRGKEKFWYRKASRFGLEDCKEIGKEPTFSWLHKYHPREAFFHHPNKAQIQEGGPTPSNKTL